MPQLMPVRIWPDSFLNKTSTPIVKEELETEVSRELIFKVLDAMANTMKRLNGLGLAMPQVGLDKRGILTVRNSGATDESIVEMLNPVIIKAENEFAFEGEGCLSFPGLRVNTLRFKNIRVGYQTRTGESKEEDLEGLNAVIVQHETDHLQGKLLLDGLSQMKRDILKRHMIKKKKEWAKMAMAQEKERERQAARGVKIEASPEATLLGGPAPVAEVLSKQDEPLG